MGSRFGRNQKRRMRDQIVAAEENAKRSEAKAWAAARRARDAENSAFNAFLADAGRYEYLCNRLVDRAAREVGEKLRPQVEKIMQTARMAQPLMRVSVDARLDEGGPIEIVRLEVPRIIVSHADYAMGRW
jgi:hypothetical protein